MDNMLIEIQTEWLGYQAGSVMSIGQRQGKILIERGTAKEISAAEFAEKRMTAGNEISEPDLDQYEPEFRDEQQVEEEEKALDAPPADKQVRRRRIK